MSDKALNNAIRHLVNLLFRPKVITVDGRKPEEILSEPSILVCNHTSHLDGPVVNTVFHPHRIHSLAAKDRFEQKGFGFFLRRTYCIPINRKSPSDISWIHASLKVLKVDKESVAIYPEGRHGEHRKQLPFHSGVTTLAFLAGVPVVLVYIDGPHKAFRRTSVVIDKPVLLTPPTGGLNEDYVKTQTAALQKRMAELMGYLT